MGYASREKRLRAAKGNTIFSSMAGSGKLSPEHGRMVLWTMVKRKGVLIISLDFELHWGVRDKRTVESYKDNLLGVRRVVPCLLKLFGKHKIHATWATVGFLFSETRDDFLKGLPTERPSYANSRFSPHEAISEIGSSELEDPFHYASSLIRMIACSPGQEIGTHTFSHYYCLESGQNIRMFECDLNSATQAAKRLGLCVKSIVFPRNQFNAQYLSVVREMGIKAYRGNQPSWIYRAKNQENTALFLKVLRSMDAYFNISGYNCHPIRMMESHFPFNICASRFLRPYSSKFRIMEQLRLRRILSELSYAAERGLVYHLWWHPHNFGADIESNISFLKKILDHYLKLQKSHGMESLNMEELSDRLVRGHYGS